MQRMWWLIGCLVATVVVGILVVGFYQSGKNSVALASVPTSTQSSTTSAIDQQYVADLAKVNPNCAKYYETSGQGPDPIDNELSSSTDLHPLSDFVCGDYSDIQSKAKLPDGKFVHFVAPVGSINCGASGHCSYYPLLEEKPGLVRLMRGFASYNDDGSVSQNPDGTIFAWDISYDSPKNTLLVDDTHAGCGTHSTYKFNAQDEPTLVLVTNYDCSTNSTTTVFKL